MDPSSTQYLELVNGTQLKLKDLGIVKPHKDTVNTTLSEFIADSTFNGDGTVTTSNGQVLDKMTFIFLQGATDPAQKAFVYIGTNNGTSDDFVSFSVDYNQGTIRSFFSGTGVGLNYTAGTGSYSIDFGNSTNQLGAHSIPVDANEFSVVTGGTILAILKALETLITEVDAAASGGTATVNTRLNNLAGVSGNSLTTFTQGLFTENATIKAILQESEVLHKSAMQDNNAIRSEFAAADSILQSNIDTEASARQSAITAESQQRTSADNLLQSNINATNSALSTETQRATQEENNIKSRLDVVEGTGNGSIAKAQSDAQTYTDTSVNDEQVRAEAAEAALGLKLDQLQEGDIKFIALIGASQTLSVRSELVANGETRNGADIKDVAVAAGEVFVVSEAQTVTFSDGSSIVLQADDKLMASETVSAGNLTASDFNVTQADSSALSVSSVDGQRIELKAGKLDITANSIGRNQLDSQIEADIDDKFSTTADDQTITAKSIKLDQNDPNTGSSYGLYIKKTQTGADPLTDTARAMLVENHVESVGSGSNIAPAYAHNTLSTHYQGSCQDLSMVVSGAYNEANTGPTTAVIANGSYSVSTDPQLGINVGATNIAQNGGVSNISTFSYVKTGGSGADRGVVAAVSDLDVGLYSATRQADPFPYDDIALVADAKYSPSGTKAFYAYGDAKFEGGVVEVPDATTDAGAVTLGQVKSKQRIFEFDLVDGVTKVISVPNIDLTKAIIQTKHSDSVITVSYEEDTVNGEVSVTASGGNLTGVRLLVQELECSVTAA